MQLRITRLLKYPIDPKAYLGRCVWYFCAYDEFKLNPGISPLHWIITRKCHLLLSFANMITLLRRNLIHRFVTLSTESSLLRWNMINRFASLSTEFFLVIIIIQINCPCFIFYAWLTYEQWNVLQWSCCLTASGFQ